MLDIATCRMRKILKSNWLKKMNEVETKTTIKITIGMKRKKKTENFIYKSNFYWLQNPSDEDAVVNVLQSDISISKK